MMTGRRQRIPLAQRTLDLAIIVFFLVNLLFITYVVDLEQLVIANPAHFSYPIWPPAPAVDAIHWWGRTFDPVLLARPVWWKMTIWLDDLGFGPFYLVAIYAFIAGKDWIRLPSVIYGAMLFTVVVIILGEEFAGANATPHFPIVLLANLPWLVFPIIIIARMWRTEHPFTRAADVSVEAEAVPAAIAQAGGSSRASCAY
ncbi:MAG TPA: emopamil-binding family protein [Ktedonobacterales bacterium]|nr:emopamil-binding family protein [Ktedonobacterales bacterium]